MMSMEDADDIGEGSDRPGVGTQDDQKWSVSW
jgi:hypothetical protein